MRTAIVLMLALALGGCTALGIRTDDSILSDSGREITVASAADMQGCQSLGFVTTEQGKNFQDYSSNVFRCGIDLRNQAAALGATHLVLEPPQRQDRMHGPWDSGDRGCNNCVSQSGQAFRCKGAVKPAEPASEDQPYVESPSERRAREVMERDRD